MPEPSAAPKKAASNGPLLALVLGVAIVAFFVGLSAGRSGAEAPAVAAPQPSTPPKASSVALTSRPAPYASIASSGLQDAQARPAPQTPSAKSAVPAMSNSSAAAPTGAPAAPADAGAPDASPDAAADAAPPKLFGRLPRRNDPSEIY